MFSLGQDCEFFVSSLRGSLSSSIGKIGGSKANPLKLNFISVLEDNVAVEINIPPAFNKRDWVEYQTQGLEELDSFLLTKKLRRLPWASLQFKPALLKHPDARVAGCEPDYNAFSLQMQNPADYTVTNLRAAAGHIHIGKEGLDTMEDKAKFIRACEVYISLPMSMKASEDERLRKTLYGKCGSFRPKPYGAEFRTPSNKWTTSLSRISWIWDQMEKVDDNWEQVGALVGGYDIGFPLTEAIDTCNVPTDLWDQYKQYGIEEFPDV